LSLHKNALELTRELVRMDTMNPPGAEEEAVSHLGRLLENAGFRTTYSEYAPGRTSLVARLSGAPTGKPAICFAGHIDTVPLGARAWTRDPFAADINNGKMYGRGTTDMKGGVAAYVTAAIELARKPRGKADIVLVIAAGEETGCTGSAHLAQRKILGSAGAMVIAEPTSNYPIMGHKGALWLEVETVGITAHGSMPELGVNAIYKAARAISKIEKLEFEVAAHPQLGRSTVNVGTVTGGLNLNSVPDQAQFTVDARTVPEHDHPRILTGLQTYLGEDVTVKRIVDLQGVWTEMSEPFIELVCRLITPMIGEIPTPRGAPYFTDASVLKPAYGEPPTVILGPGDMRMAHQTDEYCETREIETAAAVYYDLARIWGE